MPFGSDFASTFLPNIASILSRNRMPAPQQQFQQPEQFQFQPPQTPAMDAYRDYLDQFPERPKTGFWGRLLAGLGGASSGYFGGADAGIKTAQGMLDIPYQRKLADWAAKEEPLKQAATLENRNLGTENQYLKILAQDALGRKKIESAEGIAAGNRESREKIAEGNQDVQRERIAAEFDRLERKLATDLEREGMKGDVAREVANIRANALRESAGIAASARITSSSIGAEASKYGADKRLEGVLAGGSAVRPNAAWETMQDQNFLAQIATQYPETVQQTTSGKFVPILPGKPGWTGNEEQVRQYNELIGKLEQNRTERKVAPPRINPPPVRVKKVKLQAPDGSIREVPESEAQLWISRGAKRVR